MRLLPLVAAATAAFLVVACSSPTPPRGVTVVNNFDTKRYLGTWYEIARFDHRFERGLEKVTATYSLRDDGGLNVINKGYNPDREMWRRVKEKPTLLENPRRSSPESVVLWASTAVIMSSRSTGSTATRWFAARTATTCGYSLARQPFLTK